MRCPVSLLPRPLWLLGMLLERQKLFGWGQVVSCCPITHRLLSPKRSEHWTLSIPVGSTLDWGGLQAPIRRPCRHCGVIRALLIVSLRMLRNCCIISRSPNQVRRFLLYREPGWMCPSGCSAPPCFQRIWPQSWAYRLHSQVTSHRTLWKRLWLFIASVLNRQNVFRRLTPCWPSMRLLEIHQPRPSMLRLHWSNILLRYAEGVQRNFQHLALFRGANRNRLLSTEPCVIRLQERLMSWPQAFLLS
ncbi:hypothetical protein Amal_03251 [Acetobacter malorum]|uniref:Uncharacterized protein n=1 Tax=Acetobacter malorum TaxID=178901 RepID=A0A177G5F5_9PROT|nr:hypothetical protein Amal_03251 [Acetobacter malorum]